MSWHLGGNATGLLEAHVEFTGKIVSRVSAEKATVKADQELTELEGFISVWKQTASVNTLLLACK